MDKEFSGKSALVTGGAMGIGGAVCELFAERGAAVAVVDRAAKEAEAMAAKLTRGGAKAIAIVADVAKAAEVAAAVEKAVAAFGGLDIVSNNAGIQRYGTVEIDQ